MRRNTCIKRKRFLARFVRASFFDSLIRLTKSVRKALTVTYGDKRSAVIVYRLRKHPRPAKVNSALKISPKAAAGLRGTPTITEVVRGCSNNKPLSIRGHERKENATNLARTTVFVQLGLLSPFFLPWVGRRRRLALFFFYTYSQIMARRTRVGQTRRRADQKRRHSLDLE